MRLSQTLAVCCTVVPAVYAFTPLMQRGRSTISTTRTMVVGSQEDIVGESAMPSADPYDRIGVQEDELAIGVDATEFLQWIGSKQELIDKFQRDNKGMDEERADKEVSKFMLDAEMVNAYIKFMRDRVENPPNLRAGAKQNLLDTQTIAIYAAWLIGGASFGYIRKEIIEPKYASGEWEEFHIPLPGFTKAQEAVQSVASALHTIDSFSPFDSVHSDLDSILSMMA